MKPRRLKVYYGHHSNSYRRHPVIRLGGKYLSIQGFKIGDEVEVALEEGRIIITKMQSGKETPKFKLEVIEDVETGQREVTLIPISYV